MPRIELDHHGNPVLLADVPNAGVARVDSNAKSGNARHDARSGKFAPGGSGPRKRNTPPANVAPADYARMLDAVREAARSFPGTLTLENIQSFIQKRSKNPAAVNVQQFFAMAQQQQMADLVDILHAEFGKSKGIKLSAPRGYVKKVLAGLSEDDAAEIAQRLEARGNDPEVVNKYFFGKKLPKEKQEGARAAKAKIQASQEYWPDEEEVTLTIQEPAFNAVELANAIAKLPPPVVNVTPNITVQVPEQKPVRKEIIRNDVGMAIGVREVPDGS